MNRANYAKVSQARERSPSRPMLKSVVKSINEESFKLSAYKWKNETMYLSSTQRIVDNPSYKKIISMGSSVVPLILKDLSVDLVMWFPALKKLTGIDPVPPNARGDLNAMRDAWLAWGKQNNLI